MIRNDAYDTRAIMRKLEEMTESGRRERPAQLALTMEEDGLVVGACFRWSSAVIGLASYRRPMCELVWKGASPSFATARKLR